MSIRQTRYEYIQEMFRAINLKRLLKVRTRKAKSAKVYAVPETWFYTLPNGVSGKATEFTRSEVRARIKQRFDLKRVPVGTVFMKAA